MERSCEPDDSRGVSVFYEHFIHGNNGDRFPYLVVCFKRTGLLDAAMTWHCFNVDMTRKSRQRTLMATRRGSILGILGVVTVALCTCAHADDTTSQGPFIFPPNWRPSEYYERPEVKAAIAENDRQVSAILAKARSVFRDKNFTLACNYYSSADKLILDSPGYPIPSTQKHALGWRRDWYDWADALAASGDINAAISMYQDRVYRDRDLLNLVPERDGTPTSQLPEGAKDWDDARKRFPHARTMAWATNDAVVLEQYALLLLQANRVEEAVAVNKHAMIEFDESGLTYALSDFTPENTDVRRLTAAIHTVLAKGCDTEVGWGKYERLGVSRTDAALAELKSAIETKPDYAPHIWSSLPSH